ncbi:alpha/beta fold hydrolase [Streptomyces sp. CA2R106]|uniref:alpha/beta fold hydrolase n=1 Tax=Streptomyces sp. CA2R106 TaxID=3120153 RepID=UPI003008AF64
MSRPTTLDLPANVVSRPLETPRGAFAVLDGAPAPSPGAAPRGTVLLVPGFTGSKEDFLGLLAPLTAAGFRAVAVDGRGQFESAGPRDETAYARGELAADVLAQTAVLAAGAAADAPLHVVGHSLGGQIVRSALLSEPSAPYASLTLMSSGPAAIAADQQARTQLLLDHLPAMDMETAWQAMRALEAGADADAAGDEEEAAVPDWLDDFLHRRWIGTVPEQLLATARQLMTETDRVAELAALPLPKLVLSGEVDYAWPVPWLDDMAARLGARRVVIKDAGHSPNAEQPQDTAAALIAFWTDVEGR